jgi:hypothetical protein
MYSIGDMVDKLIIETVKTFNTREKLRSKELSDEEYVELNNRMMIFHDNTTKLCKMLNDKVEKVVKGEEKNRILRIIKTF